MLVRMISNSNNVMDSFTLLTVTIFFSCKPPLRGPTESHNTNKISSVKISQKLFTKKYN